MASIAGFPVLRKPEGNHGIKKDKGEFWCQYPALAQPFSAVDPGRERVQHAPPVYPAPKLDNPSKLNIPVLQTVDNLINANDHGIQINMDRYPNLPNQEAVLETRDTHGPRRVNHFLEVQTNDYTPRAYPVPGCEHTSFAAIRTRKGNQNGFTMPFNDPNAKPAQTYNTNDVGVIVRLGMYGGARGDGL